MLSGNLYIVNDNQGIKLADIQIECCSFGLVHSYRQKHFILYSSFVAVIVKLHT